MTSLILGTATRYVFPVMVLFSIFLLIRGHHEPGGGFVGGLIVASAVALCALAFGVQTARDVLRVPPASIIGFGLLVAIASGLWSTFRHQSPFTGEWAKVAVPLFGELEMGTPLLFDTGVYLVVTGVASAVVITLAEE